MKSIFASKLYQASNRKDRIHAALIAPSNLALVQQLAEDLDETYRTPENLGVEEEQKSESESNESTDADFNDFLVDDEEIDPSNDLVTMEDLKAPKSSNSESSSMSKPKEPDKDKSESEPKSDTSELIPESPGNEEKPAEASTNVSDNATQIKAATEADLSVLKNTLNSREDTAGVIRIAQKENEIWIYYNDDVNLNNIMVNVIDSLMKFGYQFFEFNRLARSDNAIVFVSFKSTEPDLGSLESQES